MAHFNVQTTVHQLDHHFLQNNISFLYFTNRRVDESPGKNLCPNNHLINGFSWYHRCAVRHQTADGPAATHLVTGDVRRVPKFQFIVGH